MYGMQNISINHHELYIPLLKILVRIVPVQEIWHVLPIPLSSMAPSPNVAKCVHIIFFSQNFPFAAIFFIKVIFYKQTNHSICTLHHSFLQNNNNTNNNVNAKRVLDITAGHFYNHNHIWIPRSIV